MTPHPDTPPGPGGAGGRSLYLTGAIASALMVALAVAHTGVFFAAGLPESVEDWFALFGRTRIFGTQAPALRAASGVFDWGLFVPGIGLYLSLVSVLCLLAFNVLTARRLLMLSRPTGTPK